MSILVTERDDPASVYRREVSQEWWNTQRLKHELFISEEVVEELSAPEFRNRDTALELLDDIALLQITEEVRGLAKILVREKVMPAPAAGDAIHVAIATVYGMDYLLSWNVRHLANANKVEHLEVICGRIGYVPPRMVTADIFWEYDE